MLALASQRFFLPDEESHFQALLPLLDIAEYNDTEQVSTLLRWLRGIVQILSQAGSHAHQVAQEYLRFLETSPIDNDDPEYNYTQKQEWQQAAERLLMLTKHSNSPELLANIYREYGHGYILLKEYQQTLTCLEHALEVCPRFARIYNELGWRHLRLKEYQQAIDDFNHALDLVPFYPDPYLGRGRAYDRLKAYQQALNDQDHALQLGAGAAFVCIFRARIYMALKEYRKALADWDHAEEVGTLTLRPGIVPFRQGCAHLWLKELPQATTFFTRGYERAPAQNLALWARERSRMCQTYPDVQTLHYLNEIARGDRYLAFVCRGVIFFLQGNFKQAVTELQHAATLPYDEDWDQYTDSDHAEDWHEWDAPFWLGMTYLALDQEQEARMAIEQALALEMPPILLKPLCWFEKERPRVYEQFVQPLLARYEV
jgi:tetratricopeptide (TPR) repeat protein